MGHYEQHVVPFDYIEQSSFAVPSNMNRYLMRSFDFDVLSNGPEIIVYSKILAFMFFGFINVNRPREWRGTKLGFGGGVIGGREMKIPGFVYNEFLVPKAKSAQSAQSARSFRRDQRIAEDFRRDPDKIVSSKTFEAFEHDFRLSGDSVFDEKT